MKRSLILPIALLFTLMSACFPSIGDKCESAAECPSGSVCDITAPDGYCLVQDCDPNGCPANSICVPFENDASFCLEFCESDDDCRARPSGAYKCHEGPDGLGYCYVADD